MMNINKNTIKKIAGIGFAIGSGIFTMMGAMSDQKKDMEFEAMKKTLSELQKKK